MQCCDNHSATQAHKDEILFPAEIFQNLVDITDVFDALLRYTTAKHLVFFWCNLK